LNDDFLTGIAILLCSYAICGLVKDRSREKIILPLPKSTGSALRLSYLLLQNYFLVSAKPQLKRGEDMGDMANAADASAGSKIFVGGLDRSVDEGMQHSASLYKYS
jgi:hypothetical protein